MSLVDGLAYKHLNKTLQKSIDDIESLRFVCTSPSSVHRTFLSLFRLLHQKELCTYSKTIVDCIQHQSCEMSQLCHYLIDQQSTNVEHYFDEFQKDFHRRLNELERSFNSKMTYLNDLHSTSIDKCQQKHDIELKELQCELNLLSSCK